MCLSIYTWVHTGIYIYHGYMDLYGYIYIYVYTYRYIWIYLQYLNAMSMGFHEETER